MKSIKSHGKKVSAPRDATSMPSMSAMMANLGMPAVSKFDDHINDIDDSDIKSPELQKKQSSSKEAQECCVDGLKTMLGLSKPFVRRESVGKKPREQITKSLNPQKMNKTKAYFSKSHIDKEIIDKFNNNDCILEQSASAIPVKK